MREQAIKSNCLVIEQQQQQEPRWRWQYLQHQQQQQEQQQRQFNKRMRHKSRKKRKSVEPMSTNTTATKHDQCNYYSFHRINKFLITATLLLITMTAKTTICQTHAATTTATDTLIAHQLLPSLATLRSARTGSSDTSAASGISSAGMPASTSLVAAGAVPSLFSPSQQMQQQRQLQQRQLFALLTKNREEADAAASRRFELPPLQPIDDERERKSEGRHVTETRAISNADADVASSLEITGFVADDGQQYEKAERALAAAIGNNKSLNNSNNNNKNNSNNILNASPNNCPKECSCLDKYFDCGKKHLDRVPSLPSYVQTLDLVGNKLNDTTALQIKNLPLLHKLFLKRNQLESVPKFTGLSALKQLNLANNHIQRISSEALAALPKLKALDLSKNYLHTLKSSFFPPVNRLSHLTLNFNAISSIEENTFEHMGDLMDLELNNNRLATLPAGVFKNLSKLHKLSLNNNNLEINWSTFRGLHALQKLYLKSNNIRALQDGVFHVMRGIETIELDHNGITSLSRQGLFNLTKLHYLSLSNNSISRIELDTWEFTQSLISLDLSHNNISEFKPQHLDCLQRLRYLNLGHNKIYYLVDSTFDCVKNLESLNLRRNRLAWVIEDQGASPPFKALRKLKELDLYGNNLKQITSKSLSGLNSLEALNLGGNTLATIQSGAFDYMPYLQKLTFKSLNFICDCELLWFRRWLQKNAKASSEVQVNAVCGFPEHLFDRELLSLTQAELICADTPKPVITQEPSNQLAVKGANITMECIANSPAAALLAAADELKIKWRHDYQNVRDRVNSNGNGGSSYISNTETQIHHNQSTNQTTIIGYLRLYNVSYESAGKYQCVVSNAFGTTYSQKFKISIGIHPTFLQIPSNLTIDSGDTARLVCSADGDPMPEIALQKFGASDFPAATERRLQVVREENAFIITNAKPIDTGIYTCTAESAAGEIKINASLIVNDIPQPEIPIVRTEIVQGKPSVLECFSELAAAALQHPQHREWYKDNKPFHTSLTSASERYYFSTERELLVIINTQSMDAGNYRCEITDSAKTFTVQTELTVVQDVLSQKAMIIVVALITLTFILCSTCVVCIVVIYHKRKPYQQHHSLGLSGSRGGATVGGSRVAVSQHLLSGSRGSALDQTQLTTLNRTYLQQSQRQQRPRSLADLELKLSGGERDALTEQRSCLIVTATPTYQQLLQRRREAEADEAEGLTLEYLARRRDSATPNDCDQHQDQLSSKDSGTGSDAAVKRSIDDFMLTLLPPPGTGDATCAHEPNSRGVRRASLAKPDAYSDDDNDADAESGSTERVRLPLETQEQGFVTSPVLGMSSVYGLELCDLRRDRQDNDSHNGLGIYGERERFQQNTNNNNNRIGVVSGADVTNDGGRDVASHMDDHVVSTSPTLKTQPSTNFNGTQAVDI